MKTWYSIAAKDNGKSAEISIFDEIGYWGVTGAMFNAELKALGDVATIRVLIDSPGGSVFDALNIFNALNQHKATIKVEIRGVAASAASFVAMAGDTISMPENTFMMVHNPLGAIYGNADEMRDLADLLDKIASSLIGIYVNRTKKTEAEVKALLDAQTWMTAAEAKTLGFADEITSNAKIRNVYDADRLPEHVRKILAASTEDTMPDPTFAKMVETLVTKAKLDTKYVTVFALSCKDQAEVNAAIVEAQEIIDLCALIKSPEKADEFITARTHYPAVKAALADARAKADEAAHINNGPPKGKTADGDPAPVNTASIWAKRRKALGHDAAA